jgi:YkoY family integral membrane protein
MDFIHSILGPDLNKAGLVILNLILIETLLSVDNAAVMATMVMDLPEKQRGRALRIGLFVGYIFRGLCLLFASMLIKVWWLKLLGGLYLIYLAIDFFRTQHTPSTDDDTLNVHKAESTIYKYTTGYLGKFWATVASVELMDLVFSIDNVFAAVALSPNNIYLVYFGVFVGILAMRFVAQIFVKVMGKYPFLQTAAFLVIAVLGLKLCASVAVHFYPHSSFAHIMENESTDAVFSGVTAAMFVLPIVTSKLFNYPKHK